MKRTGFGLWSGCGLALVALAGCGESSAPTDMQEGDSAEASSELATQNALSANALSANALSANALSANALSANALSANALSANALSANALSANALSANALNDASLSPDPKFRTMGQLNEEFLRYAYSCAMPAGSSMTLALNRGNVTFEGSVGLAPEWGTGACNLTCQRWVSACMIARINAYKTPIDISLRGNHPALAATATEVAEYPIYEGRFWGNVFTNEFQDRLMSCNGPGASLGQQTSRVCAQSGGDCGMKATGPCNSNGTTKATPAGGGTPIDVPSIAVYLKQPSPAHCGDLACEAGENATSCPSDCPEEINASSLETGSQSVVTRVTAALDNDWVFHAGEGYPSFVQGITGTGPVYLVKQKFDGGNNGAVLMNIGRPVSIVVAKDQGRVIVASASQIRAFDLNLALKWQYDVSNEDAQRNPIAHIRIRSLALENGKLVAEGRRIVWDAYENGFIEEGDTTMQFDLLGNGNPLSNVSVASQKSQASWTDTRCNVYTAQVGSTLKLTRSLVSSDPSCGSELGWTAAWPVPGISYAIPVNIEAGVVAGHSAMESGTRKSFIGRFLDGSNGFAWVNVLTAPAGRSVVIHKMMRWGQVVVVGGTFQGPIDFRGSIPSTVPAQRPGVNGNEDVFVAAYDLATGELRWVRTYGGPGIDKFNTFTFDSSNRLWLFGEFVGTPNLDGLQIPAVGGATDTDGMRLMVGPLPMGTPRQINTGSASRHTLFVLPNGSLVGWGENFHGELAKEVVQGSDFEAQPVGIPGISGARKASTGQNFSLVLLANGTVKSVGYNGSGQLGDGTLTSKTSFVSVSGLSGVVDVVAGGFHGLALLANGTVKAWGRNADGQLGDGSTSDRSTPVTVPGLYDIIAIGAGPLTSYALDIRGQLWTWGDGADGKLGHGTTDDIRTPQKVAELTQVVQASMGNKCTLALRVNGDVVGFGNCSIATSSTPTLMPGVPKSSSIAAGSEHFAAVANDGTLWMWGKANSGQLAGALLPATRPAQQVPGFSRVHSVQAGARTTFVELENREVRAFGWWNELGAGSFTEAPHPTPTSLRVPRAQDLGGGKDFVLAVLADGTVWATGDNANGQLGNNQADGTSRKQMKRIFDLTDVNKVTDGAGQFALALLKNGTVKSWGVNTYGQLGDGSTTLRKTPVTVSNVSGIVDVAADGEHALFLKKDGSVWATGRNNYGQLGTGNTTNRTSPGQVSALSSVKAIAAGGYHSVALKDDGTVWTWGYNAHGQLGIGNTTNRTSPVQVLGLPKIVKIAAGTNFTLALGDDGKVYAWGANSNGQLGDNSTTWRTSPVVVSGLSDVVAIAAGSNHSLALKADGKPYAWGDNADGEVGDGSITDRLVPVAVKDIDYVTSISASDNSSLAVRVDGSFWVWGSNNKGELGDHTVVNRKEPQQIIDL